MTRNDAKATPPKPKRDGLAKRVAAHREQRGDTTDYSYAPSVIHSAWSLQKATADFFTQQNR